MAAMLVGLGVHTPWLGVKGTAGAGRVGEWSGHVGGRVVAGWLQAASRAAAAAARRRPAVRAPASSCASRSLGPDRVRSRVRMGRTGGDASRRGPCRARKGGQAEGWGAGGWGAVGHASGPLRAAAALRDGFPGTHWRQEAGDAPGAGRAARHSPPACGSKSGALARRLPLPPGMGDALGAAMVMGEGAKGGGHPPRFRQCLRGRTSR